MDILVSIIIPCTRPEIVKNTIESVLKQREIVDKKVNIELIVVGNNLDQLNKQFPIKIVDPNGNKYSPGRARNLGAAVANGKFLIFVDDDCEVAEDWLKHNILMLSQEDVGAVGGKVISKNNKYFARCVDFSNFYLCQVSQKTERALCAATLGVKKDLFNKINGFDEKMFVAEDIDFCYRIMKKGCKVIYNPDVVVYHNHGRENFSSLIKYLYYGGRKSGLINQHRYTDLHGKADFFLKVKYPPLFFYLIIPFAVFSTFIVYKTDFNDNKNLVFYLPFVFLANVAYFYGIFVWLMKDGNHAYSSD